MEYFKILSLTALWMLILNAYVDYVVSRDLVDQPLIVISTVLIMVYTLWQSKLIIKFIIKKTKK